MSSHPDRLEAELRDRLGENLRSFWTYDDAGSPSVRYCRSDLDAATVERRVRSMNELYREENRVLRDEHDEVLASLEGTVHMFDTVLVMHIAREDSEGGVGFSIEPSVGRSLNEFLRECSTLLHGE